MSDEEFNKHMEKKHPTKQMTIQQTRSAEEEREWEDQQRVKAMKQLKQECHREQEEDRKRRLYGETSDPVPGTSSESPKKKRRKSKPPTRLTQMRMTTMVKNLSMTTNLDPDFKPEEEEEDDDEDDNGGNDNYNVFANHVFFFLCLLAYLHT